ncbi:hypothetical protein FRC0552_01996 [Corynebacterium diphtheriae]|nr:hypothetical protein FRC0552_01996 [Corynebacterium diphtheriae]
MSTGHCSTQAPQLVHDHNTSSLITPLFPANASTSTESWEESKYSMAASRRSVTSILGLRGFSVFHAGHCSWQRPHSVQVETSRSIFQGASSIVPTPSMESSSAVSNVSTSPSEYNGCNLPNACEPSGLRRKKILKNAKKRCHATPHDKLWATTTSQIMPLSSFTSANMLTSVGLAGSANAIKRVTQSAHADACP